MTDEAQRIEQLLQAILEESRRTYAIMVEIRTLLESKAQSPSMGGWVDPPERSQKPKTSHPPIEDVRVSALVDLCKRLERCYKSKGRADRFIDFQSTRQLVHEIHEKHGMTYLMNYIRFCEALWSQDGHSIGRPERMREQYFAFAAQHDFNAEVQP